ncbi:MAG: glycosyltransferase family 2 protein [Cyanobacteria bacterium J06623_5]
MTQSLSYPAITVVIPSFNQGEFIEETLVSVIGQCYPNLEIIVIDGGSTDGTTEIIEKYAKHIHYWHSKPDKGQADAINQGMQRSSGDILCWLNSDDLYLPGTLLDIGRRFQNRLQQNYLIYGGSLHFSQREEQLSGHVQAMGSYDPVRLTYCDFIAQPSAFWTRQLWLAAAELNSDYHYVLDWEWFIRASRIAQFEYVPKLYSLYRFHDAHKSSTGGTQRCREIFEVVEKYAPEYWQTLYREIVSHHEQIGRLNSLMDRLKVPKKHIFLACLFPQLLYKSKRVQDIGTVLSMCLV